MHYLIRLILEDGDWENYKDILKNGCDISGYTVEDYPSEYSNKPTKIVVISKK